MIIVIKMITFYTKDECTCHTNLEPPMESEILGRGLQTL